MSGVHLDQPGLVGVVVLRFQLVIPACTGWRINSPGGAMRNYQGIKAPLVKLAIQLSRIFCGLITVFRQVGASYAAGTIRFLAQLAHKGCECLVIGAIAQIQPLQHARHRYRAARH